MVPIDGTKKIQELFSIYSGFLVEHFPKCFW
jgi:hypothetical protein